MHVLYLHGFASSPQSAKAVFFGERFAERGVRMHCPDLNRPDFATLTISRMLGQLDAQLETLQPGNVVLIGSSLGGLVAVEAAARRPRGGPHPISQLVLLAPAVELEWDKWTEVSTHGIPAWRRSGAIDLFHYGYDEVRSLEFGFHEDAIRYHTAAARLRLPMLIFQGRQDESVSPALVETFARAQPQATLFMLEDGHQLKSSLDFIWQETSRALFPDSPLAPHPLPL